MKIQLIKGCTTKKINVFKEFTLRKPTYELRCQENERKEKGSSFRIQDKQTPHTTLQKLSPKMTTSPLSKKFSVNSL